MFVIFPRLNDGYKLTSRPSSLKRRLQRVPMHSFGWWAICGHSLPIRMSAECKVRISTFAVDPLDARSNHPTSIRELVGTVYSSGGGVLSQFAAMTDSPESERDTGGSCGAHLFRLRRFILWDHFIGLQPARVPFQCRWTSGCRRSLVTGVASIWSSDQGRPLLSLARLMTSDNLLAPRRAERISLPFNVRWRGQASNASAIMGRGDSQSPAVMSYSGHFRSVPIDLTVRWVNHPSWIYSFQSTGNGSPSRFPRRVSDEFNKCWFNVAINQDVDMNNFSKRLIINTKSTNFRRCVDNFWINIWRVVTCPLLPSTGGKSSPFVKRLRAPASL